MPTAPLIFIVALLISVLSPTAQAVLPPPPPPRLEARAWILVDADSGRVITSRNADEAAEPARLAAEGRNLRKRILQAPDVRAIPPDILAEMASYARDCGAAGIAERLAQRIAQLDGQGTGRRAGGGGPPISRPPGVQFP